MKNLFLFLFFLTGFAFAENAVEERRMVKDCQVMKRDLEYLKNNNRLAEFDSLKHVYWLKKDSLNIYAKRKMNFNKTQLAADHFYLTEAMAYSSSLYYYFYLKIWLKSTNFTEFVKVNVNLYKNGQLVLTDYSYIDFETYGYSGMSPYSHSFVKIITDKVDFDSLSFNVEFRNDLGDDLFYCDGAVRFSNLRIQGSFFDYLEGTCSIPENYALDYLNVFTEYYDNGDWKIYDKNYLDESYLLPANVRIRYVNETFDEVSLTSYIEDANIAGWMLGDEDHPDTYVFPRGTVLDQYEIDEVEEKQLGFEIIRDNKFILKNASGVVVDEWTKDRVDHYYSNTSYGIHELIVPPDSYDDVRFYYNYQIRSLEGSGDIPPNIPKFTEGDYTAKADESMNIRLYLLDHNSNDAIQIKVDWGDGQQSSWFGSYKSKNLAMVSHVYDNPGDYQIKVASKNTNAKRLRDDDVNWSYPVNVHVDEPVYEPLAFQDVQLNSGVYNEEYECSIVVSGGLQPYEFSLSSGRLPDGLTLSSQGKISGVPVEYGDFNFEIKVDDSQNPAQTLTGNFEMTITVDSLRFLKKDLADIPVSDNYIDSVKVQGGVPPYAFSVSEGELPAGIVMNDRGCFSGKADSLGDFEFTLVIKDSKEPMRNEISESFIIQVYDPDFIFVDNSLSLAFVDSVYRDTIVISGGKKPFSFQLMNADKLPNGLSIDDSGTLSGVFADTGTYSLSVKATDSQPVEIEKEFTVMCYEGRLNCLSPGLKEGIINEEYSDTVKISGGIAPYDYSVVEGSLPEGITMDSKGVIQGTPSVHGTFEFKIQVTDSYLPCHKLIEDMSMTIHPKGLMIMTDTLANAWYDSTYSDTLAFSGGVPPYVLSLSEDSLPKGLTLDSLTGVVSGKPEEAGEFQFKIEVNDGLGTKAVKNVLLKIEVEKLKIATECLNECYRDSVYSDTLCVKGGYPPFIWSVVDGKLPQGLRLDSSSGVIYGTAENQTNQNIIIKVEDSQVVPDSSTRSFSFSVLTGILDAGNEIINPVEIQNVPNPFSGGTMIYFQLKTQGKASIRVYDINGQLVRKIFESFVNKGRHEVYWDGKDKEGKKLASGIYLIHLSTRDCSKSIKCLMIK